MMSNLVQARSNLICVPLNLVYMKLNLMYARSNPINSFAWLRARSPSYARCEPRSIVYPRDIDATLLVFTDLPTLPTLVKYDLSAIAKVILPLPNCPSELLSFTTVRYVIYHSVVCVMDI
jgi:hypothetical protein